MTGSRINQGLAVVPGQEHSSPVSGRTQSGDQSACNERRHQERIVIHARVAEAQVANPDDRCWEMVA